MDRRALWAADQARIDPPDDEDVYCLDCGAPVDGDDVLCPDCRYRDDALMARLHEDEEEEGACD